MQITIPMMKVIEWNIIEFNKKDNWISIFIYNT